MTIVLLDVVSLTNTSCTLHAALKNVEAFKRNVTIVYLGFIDSLFENKNGRTWFEISQNISVRWIKSTLVPSNTLYIIYYIGITARSRSYKSRIHQNEIGKSFFVNCIFKALELGRIRTERHRFLLIFIMLKSISGRSERKTL